jgi:CPA2 family monovalent cation:H+ antiporter-2
MAVSTEDVTLLPHLAILLSISTAVSFLFRRMKLPTVLGYLVTGVLLGPQALGLIRDPDLTHQLAHIGILFLLFITGLELSASHLKQLKWIAPLAGAFQMILTTLLLTAATFLLGLPLQLAFLVGLILSLSSTALVLQSLEDLDELDTPHGRIILGILVIQDLSTIVLMTLIPTLTKPLGEDWLSILGVVSLRASFALVLAGAVSFWLVPKLLDQVAAARSREVFILAVASIGIGMSVLTGVMGLSYEAGAFLAGLALSSSIYSDQAIADSRPFREVFATVFFVSVGLMLDIHYFASHFAVILLLASFMVMLKGLAIYGAVKGIRQSTKVGLWSALSLFQIGELSFVLLTRALEQSKAAPGWQLILEKWSPLLINTIVLSMFLTPLVITAIPKLLYRFKPSALSEPDSSGVQEGVGSGHNSHKIGDTPEVVIAGFGPIAQGIVKVLQTQGISFSVIELNAKTVKKLQKNHIPVIYGDVTHPDILRSAGIEQARLFCLTFPDFQATELTLKQVKMINPEVFCLVRARYRNQAERLRAHGADQVIYEEFELTDSFLYGTFHHLGLPLPLVENIVKQHRQEQYLGSAVKTIGIDVQGQPQVTEMAEMAEAFGRLSLATGGKLEWLYLAANSPLVGVALGEANLRQETGVNVLAILKDAGQSSQSPTPDYVLEAGDVLVVMGQMEEILRLEERLSPEELSSEES